MFEEVQMSDSVYKVITLVGTSTESWEKAARSAVEAAAHSLRELRIAEVVKQDLVITHGKVEAYRTKVRCRSSTKAMIRARAAGRSGDIHNCIGSQLNPAERPAFSIRLSAMRSPARRCCRAAVAAGTSDVQALS
jgi:flavin-binding protein dodecin